MKANELMIGDWVIFHDSGYASDGTTWEENRVCQIDSIDEDVRVKWYDESGCKEYEPHVSTVFLSPIPLTPEVLEKNGFIKFNFCGIEGQHKWTWCDDRITSVSLWCRQQNDNTKDGWMIRIESPTSSLCVKVEFLHKIQHALRLCGISKEIEL